MSVRYGHPNGWELALDLVELHGSDGWIVYRPITRPLSGAWWRTDVPDPSPETSALIRRLDRELA